MHQIFFYIHQYGDIINDSIKIAENIWTGGDFNQLTEYLDLKIIDSNKIKFFLRIFWLVQESTKRRNENQFMDYF